MLVWMLWEWVWAVAPSASHRKVNPAVVPIIAFHPYLIIHLSLSIISPFIYKLAIRKSRSRKASGCHTAALQTDPHAMQSAPSEIITHFKVCYVGKCLPCIRYCFVNYMSGLIMGGSCSAPCEYVSFHPYFMDSAWNNDNGDKSEHCTSLKTGN